MNLQGILIGTGILWALNALVVHPLTHHIVKKKLASRSRVETQKTGRRARGMLLIIEIALTVSAWRKGWRARALLPLGIGMLLAAFVAMVAASAGVSPEAITGSLILFDLAAVGTELFDDRGIPVTHVCLVSFGVRWSEFAIQHTRSVPSYYFNNE